MHKRLRADLHRQEKFRGSIVVEATFADLGFEASVSQSLPTGNGAQPDLDLIRAKQGIQAPAEQPGLVIEFRT